MSTDSSSAVRLCHLRELPNARFQHSLNLHLQLPELGMSFNIPVLARRFWQPFPNSAHRWLTAWPEQIWQITNLASNQNSNRQNCSGPRLGGERLPVYLYQLTVTTNILTNNPGNRLRTEGMLVNRVARANLGDSNLASNHNPNRQNCGGPRLGEGDDDFPYGDKSGRVFLEQHSYLHSKSSTFSEHR